MLAFVDDKQIDSPYDAGTATYAVDSAAAFYQSKPLFVIKRLAKLASITRYRRCPAWTLAGQLTSRPANPVPPI